MEAMVTSAMAVNWLAWVPRKTLAKATKPPMTAEAVVM
jgi:hypothetical protein